jgi:hypothetical protein
MTSRLPPKRRHERRSTRPGPSRVARIGLAAALLASGVAFAQGCKTVSGTVGPLQAVACPHSPGLCYQGTFSGDLNGSFLSTLTTLEPNFEQGTLAFFAHTVIETKQPNGVLHTIDAGTATGCELMNGQYVCPSAAEVMTIVSGARAYTQASGTIHLSGGYLVGAPGVYRGDICIGKALGRQR